MKHPSWLVWTVACITLCSGTLHADSRRREFMWKQANAQMATAEAREAYLRAAESYMDLVAEGVRNGPLFYNLGTSLMQANLYEIATRMLCRAERYMGSNPDIRRNLALALAQGDARKELSLPWTRTFFFWHYALSVPLKSTVCSIAFAVFWLGLTCRILGARRSSAPLIGASLCVLVVIGSSLVAALHQESVERNREWQDREAIIAARAADAITDPEESELSP